MSRELSKAQAIQDYPWLEEIFRRRGPKDYDEFVEQLYDDLHLSFNDLERQASEFFDKNEDHITTVLCMGLRKLGYAAQHSAFQSGLVDITVSGPENKYSWMGEAKIYRAVENMREGFLQLVTRYAGAVNERRGALLAYVQKGVTAEKVEAWKVELSDDKQHADLATRKCVRRDGVAFISDHKHVKTGLAFEVWHVAISLQFDPQDKSARNRRRNQS